MKCVFYPQRSPTEPHYVQCENEATRAVVISLHSYLAPHVTSRCEKHERGHEDVGYKTLAIYPGLTEAEATDRYCLTRRAHEALVAAASEAL